MTNTTKLHADGIFVSEDKALIQDIQMIHKAKANLPEEQFNLVFKQLCDKVREAIGLECVIGLALNDDNTAVGIPYFLSIKSSYDNQYKLGFEEETGQFYMELEKPLPLEIIDLEIKECEENIELSVDFDDAKEYVENLNNLHELRKDMVAYLGLMQEVDEFVKSMLGETPIGIGILVRA